MKKLVAAGAIMGTIGAIGLATGHFEESIFVKGIGLFLLVGGGTFVIANKDFKLLKRN